MREALLLPFFPLILPSFAFAAALALALGPVLRVLPEGVGVVIVRVMLCVAELPVARWYLQSGKRGDQDVDLYMQDTRFWTCFILAVSCEKRQAAGRLREARRFDLKHRAGPFP